MTRKSTSLGLGSRNQLSADRGWADLGKKIEHHDGPDQPQETNTDSRLRRHGQRANEEACFLSTAVHPRSELDNWAAHIVPRGFVYKR